MNPFRHFKKDYLFPTSRQYWRDIVENGYTGRFNTLLGYFSGMHRIHAFQPVYRWAVANGYKKPVPAKKRDDRIPYSPFDYYPY